MLQDKSNLFGNSLHEDYIEVSKDRYSVGVEIEFINGSKWFNHKYNKRATTNGTEYYSTLGFDGAGAATKEFRSPVFISDTPEDCLTQMKQYVVEVQEYLLEEFKSKFAPFLSRRPFGIHFSVGGKFKNIDIANELIFRSKIIQPKLRSMVDEKDIILYDKREQHYSGKIPEEYKLTADYRRYFWCNAIRQDSRRLEFRYLPSCDITTVFPVIDFVVLGISEPVNNKIKFIK